MNRADDDVSMRIDGAVVGLISVAICAAADRLVVMTVLVPLVILARFVAWNRFRAQPRGTSLSREILFFCVCTLLGGFNDWNSVVRHRVYDYTVPVFFPTLSTIPLWMLLFWGMILRFMASVSVWISKRFDSPPRATIRLPSGKFESARVKIIVQILLMVATRQSIYKLHADPILSWLPFAVALGLYVALFRLDRGDLILLGLLAIAGPLVEILYIQVGHLHRYSLGWLGGVPLWIVMWWMLGGLIWKDLTGRWFQWQSIRRAELDPSIRAGRIRDP